MSSMLPPACSTAAFKFSHTWRVCASISPMPAIVPSARRAVMPEMNTSRPRASSMGAWEKWPDGWRIFAEVICCLGIRLLLDARRAFNDCWWLAMALADELNSMSLRRAIGLRCLALRSRFDLDEDVAVLPITAVVKLVGDAGFAPDHLAWLFLGLPDAAVVERHLVLAFGQRHDEIRQQMLVPWLTLPGIERDAPHPHEFVLEQDLVADRSQHAHRSLSLA